MPHLWTMIIKGFCRRVEAMIYNFNNEFGTNAFYRLGKACIKGRWYYGISTMEKPTPFPFIAGTWRGAIAKSLWIPGK